MCGDLKMKRIEIDFDKVRPIFGGSLRQHHVDGINTIISKAEKYPQPLSFTAYNLGTAVVETGFSMQPVRETEFHGRRYTDAQVVARLDRAYQQGRLKQVKKPYWRVDSDGKSWFGRGYVQITHKDNYRRVGDRIGVDLVEDPSRALNPDVAATIMVIGCQEGLFSGRRLGEFLPGDFYNARKVVNGLDRAQEIADYASRFLEALTERDEPEKLVADSWLLRLLRSLRTS